MTDEQIEVLVKFVPNIVSWTRKGDYVEVRKYTGVSRPVSKIKISELAVYVEAAIDQKIEMWEEKKAELRSALRSL